MGNAAKVLDNSLASMTDWNSTLRAEVAEVFAVRPERVSVGPHPLEADALLLRVAMIRGRNVAAAIASVLNARLYERSALDAGDLHYQPNRFAFIEEGTSAIELCLTIDQEPRSFVHRLQRLANEISYASFHPSAILFPDRSAHALVDGGPDSDFTRKAS